MKKVLAVITLLFTAQLFSMQEEPTIYYQTNGQEPTVYWEKQLSPEQEAKNRFFELPYELQLKIAFEHLMDVNPLNLQNKQNLERFMNAVYKFSKSERKQLVINAAQKYFDETGKPLNFKAYLKQGDTITDFPWRKKEGFSFQELWDTNKVPKKPTGAQVYGAGHLTLILDNKKLSSLEGIENYPAEIRNKVTAILLNNNNLTEVNDIQKIFQYFPNLEYLDLTRNDLTNKVIIQIQQLPGRTATLSTFPQKWFNK